MNQEPDNWTLNYFNYFTEVEEHFQRTRGSGLFLFSPLDWALIEIWKNSGVPLEAVLRGIDCRRQARPDIRFGVIHREVQVLRPPARLEQVGGGVVVAHDRRRGERRLGHGFQGDLYEVIEAVKDGRGGREAGHQVHVQQRAIVANDDAVAHADRSLRGSGVWILRRHCR